MDAARLSREADRANTAAVYTATVALAELYVRRMHKSRDIIVSGDQILSWIAIDAYPPRVTTSANTDCSSRLCWEDEILVAQGDLGIIGKLGEPPRGGLCWPLP